jgi:Holliday junction resolvase RusA-like endonuclease
MKLLADFEVFGMTPVPWSPPTVIRRGRPFPDKRMSAWQDYVHLVSQHHPGRPSLGPIALDITFLRRTPPGKRHGEVWSQPVVFNPDLGKFTKRGENTPDLTNLLKGFEDGMRNVFYEDDVQVSSSTIRRLYGRRDGVLVRVYEIEPGDYPGEGEPIDV